MATQLPHSQRQRKAPAKVDVPSVVRRHDSDKAATYSLPDNLAVDDGVYPFPLADIVGTPIRTRRPIPLHRMAQATNDDEMIWAIRDRLGKPVHVVIGRSPLLDLACYGVIAVAVIYFGVQLLRWFL